MNKIKIQKIINLLNYQQFLKKSSLKKPKFKLKEVLYDNPIILKKKDFKIIEFNNFKNISIPVTILDYNRINTIKISYENQILFNYNLNNINANIIYNFNNLMLNYILKKKKAIVEGRVLFIKKTYKNKYLNKYVFISILGRLFKMSSINLNKRLKYLFYKKKKLFFNDFNKNKFYNTFNKNKIIKKKKKPAYVIADQKISKFINTYKNREISFKVFKKKNKIRFSRCLYVKEISKIKYKIKYKNRFKNKQIKNYKNISISGKVGKKNKKNLSDKVFEKKIKQKQRKK